jgi:hypothetical protein
MARVSNPLIGKSKNKIGGVVFSTWKGINVLKEKPASVANPNTDSQQMHRSALTQMTAFFRQIPAIVKSGFKKMAIQMSEWNAFASQNLRNAFNYSSPPTATLVYGDVLISKGTISATTPTSVSGSNASPTVAFNYPTSATAPGQSADDKILAVVYNATQDTWGSAYATAARSAGTVNVTMPTNNATSDTLHTYLGFFNELSGESSDSVYTLETI